MKIFIPAVLMLMLAACSTGETAEFSALPESQPAVQADMPDETLQQPGQWGLPELEGYSKEILDDMVVYIATDGSHIMVQQIVSTSEILEAFRQGDAEVLRAEFLGMFRDATSLTDVEAAGELYELDGKPVFIADIAVAGSEELSMLQGQLSVAYYLPGEGNTVFYIIGGSYGTYLAPGMEKLAKAL